MEEFSRFAEELADAAGDIIREYWRKPLDVEDKVELDRAIHTSPVTIADRKVEQKMREMIESKYPSHGIYGEEFGHTRVDAEYVWVLDPIDGTKSFITGKPLFGTLIALLHLGKPVVGVIDQCVLRERWVGATGMGTKLNGQRIMAKGCAELKDALLYATTPHMFAQGVEEACFMKLRKNVKRALYGCDCYAYALVASGFGTDLVVEADLGLYDYCALVPVVENAGGVMTDWTGAALTLQNHDKSMGRVVAAANSALHAQALKYLNKQDSKEMVAILEGEVERLRSAIAALSSS